MHIEPNSTVIVCTGVPWDPDYTHAMNWGNMGKETQASIVKTYKKFEFNRLTYQRSNRGYIRVEKCVDELYDCNYLMFQNTNYGDKWFYAFITQVNYINDITTEILYAIDIITTWWFDCEVGTCFIDRAHTPTDEPGENLNPENVEQGEYVIPSGYEARLFEPLRELKVEVVSTFKYDKSTKQIIDDADPDEENFSPIPLALFYTFFNVSLMGEHTEFFQMMQAVNKAGKIDGIVGIYVVPEGALRLDKPATVEVATTAYSRPTNINGYVPQNKKLLTMPYTLLYITDSQDRELSLGFEYFVDPNNPTFRLAMTCGPAPTVIVKPVGYKTTNPNTDPAYYLYSQPYPKVPYINDVYKNWLAQNENSMVARVAIQSFSPLLHSFGNLFSAGIQDYNMSTTPTIDSRVGPTMDALVNTPINLLESVAQVEAQKADRRVQPNTARGVGDNLTLANLNEIGFKYCVKQITPEFAKRIDNFFTMFGYAINELGTPKDYIGKRKSHCFIKTIGAHIDGSVPADHAKAICAIYDHGITFWNNQTEIGDYSLDNSPM